MELTKRQLLTAQQAVGYAVMYAKTESETAEFALLKLDIDGALIRIEASEQKKAEHDKMDCPFNYCDSNPKCQNICHHSSKPYEVSKVKCDLCTNEWVAVRTEGLTKLECPNCWNMVNFENV
jgi:formate dehydrogenase maturation protein FdhE